jgi:hypothetical protein
MHTSELTGLLADLLGLAAVCKELGIGIWVSGPGAERLLPGLVSERKRTFDQLFRSLQIPERLSTPFWASLAGSGAFWASGCGRAGRQEARTGRLRRLFGRSEGLVDNVFLFHGGKSL